MSSDLQLKKLRGSGGYVMASVTDEQQSKGNLGGPDLFLAPMGRLESDKISKHHCNTCDKDFEGAPKIDYETLNEVVAENLILLEKGEYVCTSCGSVIAEYRNFQKQDEASQVGLAKPETMAEQIVQSSMSQEPESPAQSQTELTFPDMTPSTPAEPTTPDTDFSTIVGFAVYDSEAQKVGTIKSVGAKSGQLVAIVTKIDGTDTTIRWNQVKKVGEIILLGETLLQTIGSKCDSCGFENKSDSKFCESCGGKL